MLQKIELQNLVGGALQEKFSKSFEKVVENIQDQNTSFKIKRGITINLSFVQNEARDDVSVSIDVKEKLAPQAGLTTQFAIGKDLKTGAVYAEEYGRQVKGQMSFNDYSPEQIIDGQTINTDTGEIIEPKKDENGVVDFRKAAMN